MAKPKASCGLYLSAASDLRASIELIENNSFYSFLVVPLFHPGLVREVVQHSDRPLSRSCRIFDNKDMNNLIVGSVSKHIDVDSPDLELRKRSEILLKEELNYAAHVNFAAILLHLNSMECVNLARIVSSWFLEQPQTILWIQLPLANPQVALDAERSDVGDNKGHITTWEWWNRFRTLCDHHSRLGVVLEIGADLPAPSDRNRWRAEPVRAVFLPSSIFLTNRSSYPVLSSAHQKYLREFSEFQIQVIIAGPIRHQLISSYAKYLSYVWNLPNASEDGFSEDATWADCLQNPLQPLMNNLEAQTYEIFEKDPVKYRVYKDAIHEALLDRVSDDKKNEIITVIMVMGAGRGPLVKAALEAADEADRKVKVYAVEKNPNAIITLRCRRDDEWKDRVQVIAGDMRKLDLKEKADILVSELLGSFGDNELSPECLDGAQVYLKDDGISIPCDYTSYICPVMSHKLFSEARSCQIDHSKPVLASLETSYVVLQKNKRFLKKPVPLFKFTHPNKDEPIDNSRYESRIFPIRQNCVLHGFSGFFHATLYKNSILSIVPETFSTGMFSWYPIYFPLSRPVKITAGDDITAHFWRCVGEKDVWYEWTISTPEPLPMHNPNGRSSKIGL